MVLLSKNKKNQLCRSAFLFSCRLLTVNLTKNDTPPWMFLFHFAIEKFVLVSKLLDLLLIVGSRIDFIEVDSTLQ